MTDSATGKNWMSKTFSLQNFSSDAYQSWVNIIAKWRQPIRRISSTSQFETKQGYSYQGEALNVPTAF